jgi:hypothetical protein
MFIVLCSQKVFSAPVGRHIHAQMSLLTELTRFFLPELYPFRAAGASQLPIPPNPMRSATFYFIAASRLDVTHRPTLDVL